MFKFLFRHTPSDPATGSTPSEGKAPTLEESRWNFLQQARNPAFGPCRNPDVLTVHDLLAIGEAVSQYMKGLTVQVRKIGPALIFTPQVAGEGRPRASLTILHPQRLSLAETIEEVADHVRTAVGGQYIDFPSPPVEKSEVPPTTFTWRGHTAEDLARETPSVLGYRTVFSLHSDFSELAWMECRLFQDDRTPRAVIHLLARDLMAANGIPGLQGELTKRALAMKLQPKLGPIEPAPETEPSFLGLTAQELNRRIPGVLGYRARWTFGKWAFGVPYLEVSFRGPGDHPTRLLDCRYFLDDLLPLTSADDLMFDVTCRVRDHLEGLAVAAEKEADELAAWEGVEVEVQGVRPQHLQAACRHLRAAARHLAAVQDPQDVASLHCREALRILEGTPASTIGTWP